MDKISRGSRIGEEFAHRRGGKSAHDGTECGSPRCGSPRGGLPSPRLECSSPRSRAAGQNVKRFASETSVQRRDTPNSTRIDPGLQDEFWKGLGKSPSARLLSSPDGKRSPRCMARNRSEGCFLATPDVVGASSPAASPRGGGFRGHSPRGSSPRVASNKVLEGFETESRNIGKDTAASPFGAERRSQSPTFAQSEDWMTFSSPRDHVRAGVETANHRNGNEDEVTMPSSNFSNRMRRMHSGRITANSEVWLRSATDQVDSSPAAPVIANHDTHIPSKGKKTGIPSTQDTAKERLRLDVGQAEARRTQRKHDFPGSPRLQKQMSDLRQMSPRDFQMSPRDAIASEGSRPPRMPVQSPRSSAGAATAQSPRIQTQGEWGNCIVDVEHRTSSSMVATLMSDAPSPGVADCKYMVGNELVDWRNNGRRIASPYPPSVTSPGVRTAATPAGMLTQGRRVHSYGSLAHQYTTAAPPSAVQYSVRASGACSPHAPRMQAVQVVTAYPVHVVPKGP